MKDEFTPDYTIYTTEQLEHELRHLDGEKYPQRFARLLQELDNRKEQIGERKSAEIDPKESRLSGYFQFHPPVYDAGEGQLGKWRISDIIFCLVFIVAPFGGNYLLVRSTFLKDRPWIAEPVATTLSIATDVVIVIFVLLMCRNRPWWRPSYPGSIRAVLKDCLLSLKYLLAAGLVVMPVGMILNNMSSESKWSLWARSMPNDIYTALTLVSTFTLVPVAEELLFRGFLYSALRSKLSLFWAISIQALIFTGCHGENLVNSIFIFAIGVALAMLYERRRNLLPPILLHMIKNAMFAIPLLVLIGANYHVPAKTWEEANLRPTWFKGFEGIERQEDGMHQWQYAVNQWGSKGSKRWKKETEAFAAVPEWFPDQRAACAKAALGIVTIYYYHLSDFRRAVVEADILLSSYPEQKEQCAEALVIKGLAYYRLKDFVRARHALERVIKEFEDQKSAIESAHRGLKVLDAMDKNP